MTEPLTPNAPLDRLQYVVKTYMGTKNQQILPDVVKISCLLLGIDNWATRLSREPWLLLPDADAGVWQLDKVFPKTHPHDFLIPWIAKELGRLRKAVLKDEAAGEDYARAATELEKKGPAIAMWALETRANLTKTSLAEALEAVKDFEVDTGGAVPQGSVVHSFDDGYTIQRLTTQAELDAEGEIMQHCVAGYCPAVTRGETVIFSLRDKRGHPHATVEWTPDDGKIGLANTLLRWRSGESALPGKFIQIRGKQNEKPAAKYLPYLQTFVRERFSGDPLALLMVATPGQTIVFKGHTLREIDFTEDYAWSGVKLEQADFRDATFIGVSFDQIDDAKFDGSRFAGCRFGRLRRCSFRKAEIGGIGRKRDHELSNAFLGNVDGTDFREAALDRGAHFSHSDVTECDFRGTIWYGEAGAHETRFVGTDLSGSRWDAADFREVAFRDCVMDGLTIDAGTELRDIVIVDTDLRKVDPASAMRLWDALAGPEVGYRAEHNVKWPRAMEARIVEAGALTRERFEREHGEYEEDYDDTLSDTGDDA